MTYLLRDRRGRYYYASFDGEFWDVPTEVYVVDDFGSLVTVEV